MTNDVDNNWLCTIIIIQLDILKRLVGVKKKVSDRTLKGRAGLMMCGAEICSL